MFIYNHISNFLDFLFSGRLALNFGIPSPQNHSNRCNCVTLLEDVDNQVVTWLLLWLQLYFKEVKSSNLKGIQLDTTFLQLLIEWLLHYLVTTIYLIISILNLNNRKLQSFSILR